MKTRKSSEISDMEEAKIQRQISSDPDNPEWTDDEIASARPFAEVFPQLAQSIRKNVRGPGKRPRKALVSLRVDPGTLAAFKSAGSGWQKLMNEALDRAAKRIAKKAAGAD